ncbi:hypothetical protein AAG906_000772 [Vitis piasezkii]
MPPAFEAILAATASFFFITLFLAVILIVCRGLKQRRSSEPRTRPIQSSSLTSISVGESATFDPSLKRISMGELLAATRNFASDGIIGDGSFGMVYKACLSNGVTVAVKKLSPDAFQGFREFRAETETLAKLQHRNIVQILGYCVSGSDRVLIYEFIEKGSLDQWLHDTSSEDQQLSTPRLPLSWETRLKIIRGVADGLSYLHNLDTPIIHRDIKASNVLLDSEFEPHIADFGLARRIEWSHSHVSTQVAGTMGYMPPEYREGVTVATVKADVYSFGILMIEIATGRRPNLPTRLDGTDVGIVQWARKMVAQERHMEMVDSNVSREGLRENEVRELFRIAHLCTSEISRDRPPISLVVDLLYQLFS